MDILLQNPAALGLIVGVFLPLVTSIVQNPRRSRPMRVAVAVAMAIAAAIPAVIASGQFDPANWLATIAAVLVAAQASFESLWKPSGVTDMIESATSKNPVHYE